MEITSIDLFGADAELDHVGMAVNRIDDVLPDGVRVTDRTQKVTVGFLDLHGLTIELIEPAAEDSPISAQLQKGVKLLHLCYRVKNLEAAIRAARAAGLFPIAPPAPAKAFEGRRIAWLFSRTMGLFELVEATSEDYECS
jgi:methylmalonyl-CoA/ethylmalonyl-CoA epimerase